jgi:acyl carrier protein
VNNGEKLITAFAEGLKIDPSRVNDDLSYNNIREWDSIAHMQLIAELEAAFDVMLDTDDIIDLSSLSKAKMILKKYDVAF